MRILLIVFLSATATYADDDNFTLQFVVLNITNYRLCREMGDSKLSYELDWMTKPMMADSMQAKVDRKHALADTIYTKAKQAILSKLGKPSLKRRWRELHHRTSLSRRLEDLPITEAEKSSLKDAMEGLPRNYKAEDLKSAIPEKRFAELFGAPHQPYGRLKPYVPDDFDPDELIARWNKMNAELKALKHQGVYGNTLACSIVEARYGKGLMEKDARATGTVLPEFDDVPVFIARSRKEIHDAKRGFYYGKVTKVIDHDTVLLKPDYSEAIVVHVNARKKWKTTEAKLGKLVGQYIRGVDLKMDVSKLTPPKGVAIEVKKTGILSGFTSPLDDSKRARSKR